MKGFVCIQKSSWVKIKRGWWHEELGFGILYPKPITPVFYASPIAG